MTTEAFAFEPNLKDLSAMDWIERLEDIAVDHGFFEPLGPEHSAAFVEGNRTLLVCFEDAAIIRQHSPEAEPRGFRFGRAYGWSVLSVVSEGESWFRHPAIYGFFDRLTDDGFFETFDQVLFHGVHAAGYAAAAYSVAAPGARALLIRPQATLDPRVAGFDNRFRAHRREDFNSRYGFAPDMIEAADACWVVFDPLRTVDATHGSLFRRPNVTALRARGSGARVEAALDAMGIHDDLFRLAMDGTLDELSFAQAYRARRNWPMYPRNLLRHLQRSNHPRLAATLCRFVLQQEHNAFFAEELEAMAQDGHEPLMTRHKPAAE